MEVKKKKEKKKEKKPTSKLVNPAFIVKSHQPNQLAFRKKKKNLILFLNSNNSVPVAAVTLLNF